MKKNKLKIVFAAIIALTLIGYSTYNLQRSESGLSDLMLENIEALANNENDPHKQGPPLTNWKHYPVDCTTTTGITVGATVPINGIPVGGSYHQNTSGTFQGTKCGYGTGSCWSSSC